MRKIIISIAMFVASNSFSQMTETKKIVVGTGKWEIEMSIENGMDTSTYFYWGFQNMKYTHIVDKAYVFLTKKNDLIEFAESLKTLSLKENRANVRVKLDRYSLALFSFSNNIYIEDENGKYTYITKRIANKIADELILNSKYLRK